MNLFFLEKPDYKAILTISVGLMSAVLVLLLTLNFTAAFITLVMALVSLVFRGSYSRGWLFLMAVYLLFPSIRLNPQGMLLSDFLLAALALIGLVNLAVIKFKTPVNNLFYEFFLLALCGFSILSFGFILNQQINFEIWRITISMLLIWISLVSFQYYFQTSRRIKRFFVILAVVGAIHAIFGMVMFLGNWQTAGGLGISSGKTYHLVFGNINRQINGLLGLGLLDRLKTNALAPLLMASITASIGFFLIERKKKVAMLTEEEDRWDESSQTSLSKQLSFDSFEMNQAHPTADLPNWRSSVHSWILKFTNPAEIGIIAIVVIQVVALALTFSEASMVFLALGLLLMGILDRNKGLMVSASGIFFLFALILPSLNSSVSLTSSENLAYWFEGTEALKRDWLLGIGWRSLSEETNAMSQMIHNSYLYIWNNFGIIGLGILLAMLGKYFRDLFLGYKKSDGTRRIWLMVIIAIFIQMVLQAMTGNTILYGPAALIFWLLYGAAMNLRPRPVKYGITETKIIDNL